MDDEIRISDILDVWLLDAIDGLPVRLQRVDSPLAAEFWIYRDHTPNGDLHAKDVIGSVRLYHEGENEPIDVQLYIGETNEEIAIESFILDLGDPGTSGRIRAHVEKYA